MQQGQRTRAFENLAIAAVSLVGAITFLFPFLLSALPRVAPLPPARSSDASLLLAVLVAGSLLVAISEASIGPGGGGLSRAIALLAALVAIDATLRLMPTFLGASPIFALIVLVGYVFGSRFGFVMGALTLLLSAAITAGVGPWLPFQMLCAGWTGVAAGWLPRCAFPGKTLALLAVYGAAAGFLYGALMNLYAWPYTAPGSTADAGLYWSPALTVVESLARYARFYLVTSLVHDATRALATALLILVGGGPVLRMLRRFNLRATWSSSSNT
ncbi:MAG: ECF transporter S component [Thermomicrobiales bacterium]|nr:ECF transporter S component [Thermomicrobiales bacterium]